MDVSFSNIGARTSTTVSVDAGTKASKAGEANALSLKVANDDVSAFDISNLSEPVLDIPDASLLRDDNIGHLVARAFNLPPPSIPIFPE